MRLELGNSAELVVSAARTAGEGGTVLAAAVAPSASEALPALPAGMWLELTDGEERASATRPPDAGAVEAGKSSGGSLTPELLELYATSTSWSYVWLSP